MIATFATTRGAMHERIGTQSQDAGNFWLNPDPQRPFLVVALADGAGSTTHGGEGARIVCEHLVSRAMEAHQRRNLSVSEVLEKVPQWLQGARHHMHNLASSQGLTLNDYATTCLVAINMHSGAVCVQVGDGAIAVERDQSFDVVFWPENGQYANETYFVTDEDWKAHLCMQAIEGPVARLAMFTDGLQRLGLRSNPPRANDDFLQLLFKHLQLLSADERQLQLQGLVDSLRSVSDDDKSLFVFDAQMRWNHVASTGLADCAVQESIDETVRL